MRKNVYTPHLLPRLKTLAQGLLCCSLWLGGTQAMAQDNSWIIYRGNVMPNSPEVSSPFTTASVTPADPVLVETEQSIEVDPENPANRLLRFQIDGNPHISFLWRQNLPTEPAPTAATVVVRAKGIEGLERVFEMDLDFAGFRETVYIINKTGENPNGTFTFNVVRGDFQNATLGIDPLQWHTYRFSKSGATLSLYIDESATPIATAVSTSAQTRNYFRIGDGASGQAYGALIDWIAWDVTGAYSPTERPLPTAELALPDVTLTAAKFGNAALAKASLSPNPVSGNQVKLAFSLPSASSVDIQLYDITGKQVGETKALPNLQAADHEVLLPVAGLKEGIYFCRISSNQYTLTRKLIVK